MSSGIGTILSYCENNKFDTEKDEEKSKEIPDIVYDIKRALFCAIHGVGNSDDEIKRVVYRSSHNRVGRKSHPYRVDHDTSTPYHEIKRHGTIKGIRTI